MSSPQSQPHLRRLGLPLIALVAVVFGFLLTSQVRTQVIPASNRIARNAALLSSAQELVKANEGHRRQIQKLRVEVTHRESQAADSSSTRRLSDEAKDLRDHAGLTPLRGPGVGITLNRGHPAVGAEPQTGFEINYQDLQDIVNLLFAGGAEGIAINDHRISTVTYFRGSPGTILIDDGIALQAPYRIAAVGNQSQMEILLGESSSLGDLKSRQRTFQLQLSWSHQPDLRLPAYDGSLGVGYAHG